MRARRSEAQDVRVSFHIHETVAAHVERDDRPLAGFSRLQGLVDRARDAVCALRGRKEALRLDEHAGPFEDMPFVGGVGDSVNQAAVAQEGEDRGAAVVPQAVPADRRHLRAVAEGVHLQHRREFRVVGEVVPVFPLEVRGCGALGRDEADLFAMEYIREEREGETSEVRSATELGDAWTVAPYIRMNCRRCVFQSWTARTQKIVVGSPARLAAYASAVPHWPAPVSVVRRSYPSCFAYQAWARAVFTLWLPVGL